MNQEQALVTLTRYIRARYPIINILSHEESRVLAGVRAIARQRDYEVVTWSFTAGFDGSAMSGHMDPVSACKALLELPKSRKLLVVMKDLHGVLGNKDKGFNPMLTRLLRDIANHFETGSASLILVGSIFAIPPELEKVVALIDWPLPDLDELADILRKSEQDIEERNETASIPYPVTLNGNREQVAQALSGLTATEARQAIASGVIATEELGNSIIPFIVKEKAQIIKKSGVLEYFDTSITMSEVGGLDKLKIYAAQKRASFSTRAAEFGLKAPKGVLLAGLPGTGKSLAAKAIAAGTMPLIRMDVGALMGGLVGQSEQNMRSAIKTIESVAPAILWIDEVDKALGGGGDLDGGTSARVFGTLLTWMQESTVPVYIVATANNMGALKPEFIRRFDDVFWVDLPDHASRVDILKIHLKKARQEPAIFDLEAVARTVWSYTGGEIEKVVQEAAGMAFVAEQTMTTDTLLEAARKIVPLYQSMKDSLDQMRKQVPDARKAGNDLEPRPEFVSQMLD